MQLATGCNEKKNYLGCSINAVIEKINLQLLKETIFGSIKLNIDEFGIINQLQIVKLKIKFFLRFLKFF